MTLVSQMPGKKPAGETAADALARTASSVFAVLRTTHESGERELRLVAAQDAIASPAGEFAVEQVR